MAPLKTNALYYGDNLQILRDYIPDESIDLIYLDPLFFWNRKYPRIQILTIADILNGQRVETPHRDATFAQAPRERQAEGEQRALLS